MHRHFAMLIAVASVTACAADEDSGADDGALLADGESAIGADELKTTVAALTKELPSGAYVGQLTTDRGRRVSTKETCQYSSNSCMDTLQAKCRVVVRATPTSYSLTTTTDWYWQYEWRMRQLSLTLDDKHIGDEYKSKVKHDSVSLRYLHENGLKGHTLRQMKLGDGDASFETEDVGAFGSHVAEMYKWQCSNLKRLK